MARAIQSDVRGVIETDPDISLLPFINAATLIVNRVNTCATSKGYTLTSDELLQIEIWLAAHLYSHRDQRYKSKSTGRASASFEDTSYLTAAQSIDPSGCLVAFVKGQRASIDWLGLPKSQQTDYIDRD